MMTLAQTERAALADLLIELGPDQPTLCDGWNTGDLLGHLLVRERRVDAALGVVVKPLAPWTAYVTREYRKRPWADQVHLLRSGPPGFSPFAWGSLDEKGNGMELFIHHEDVRRGQPDWQPRALDPAARDQLIRAVASSLMLRGVKKIGVPVTAWLSDEPNGHDRPLILVPAKVIEWAGKSPAGVTVHGGVGEVLLWLSGRSAVRLEFTGDPAALAQVRAGVR